MVSSVVANGSEESRRLLLEAYAELLAMPG